MAEKARGKVAEPFPWNDRWSRSRRRRSGRARAFPATQAPLRPVITPRVSSFCTRFQHGVGDRPTLSASSAIDRVRVALKQGQDFAIDCIHCDVPGSVATGSRGRGSKALRCAGAHPSSWSFVRNFPCGKKSKLTGNQSPGIKLCCCYLCRCAECVAPGATPVTRWT